jgi:hypothetical protein
MQANNSDSTSTPPGKRRVTISIAEEIHEAGKILAREDRRDFSGFLEVTIEEMWKEAQARKREVTKSNEVPA